MRLTTSYVSVIIFTFLQLIDGARKPESVLLSNVKTLTLRKDLMTTSNRVAAVSQVCLPLPDIVNKMSCRLTCFV